MTFKQKRKLKKEFTPDYYRKFNIWASVIMLVVLVVGFAACIGVGITYDEHPATYITMLAFFVALIVMLIIVLVLIFKMRNKLLQQRTQEIVSEFHDLPFEEVTSTLLEKRVITEHGFVANRGDYAGQLVVPFNEALVSVYSANVYTKVCTVIVITNLAGMVVAEYVLDNVLFNYICKKGVRLDFVADSKYLLNDKQEFAKVHIKGNSDRNMAWFWFGAIGAYVANENNNVNLSRRTVLNVLSEEMD